MVNSPCVHGPDPDAHLVAETDPQIESSEKVAFADAAAIASARTDRPALVEMVRLLREHVYASPSRRYPDKHDLVESLWSEAKKKAGC